MSTNLADKARLHHQYSWSCSLVDRRQSRWFYTACTSTSKSLSEHPDSLHVAWKCLRRRSSEVRAFSHAPVEQTVLVSCFDSLIQQCLIRRRIKSLQIWKFSDTHFFGSLLCRQASGSFGLMWSSLRISTSLLRHPVISGCGHMRLWRSFLVLWFVELTAIPQVFVK